MSVAAEENSSRPQTLVIVGVGLIGGSIAAAVKQRLPGWRVIGVGRSLAKLEPAKSQGLLDGISEDLSAAVAQADIVVFCTPVDRIPAQVIEAAAFCKPGTLLTDAGSVKGSICTKIAAAKLPAGVVFVGSHPLAGSEKTGFEHAKADLFDGKTCVLTPSEGVNAEATERLTSFWQSLGMRVTTLDVDTHDAILAKTSHLPHLVAANLALQLGEGDREFASSGFADTTRIAGGDADLWVAILLANADAMLQSLDAFSRDFAQFRAAIAERDAEKIKLLLERAQSTRRSLDET